MSNLKLETRLFILENKKSILEKIIEDNLISIDDATKYSELFEKYKIYVPKNNIIKDEIPVDYFEVFFKTFNLSPFKEALINFQVIYNTKSSNIIYLPIEQFELFLEKFSDKKRENIHWYDISKSLYINWNNSIITKFNYLWDWNELYKNKNIIWNEELIVNNFDFIKFLYLSNEIKNELSESFYLRFKDKLLWDTISSIEKKWSFGFIEQNVANWNWNYLSKNELLEWNIEFINKHEIYINFKALSSNKNVEWSTSLLSKYLDKWDWASLSKNPKLPFSIEFITKFQDYFIWSYKPRFEDDKMFYYHDFNFRLTPCLSGNRAIIWDYQMLKVFENKIDFWIASKYCGFTNEAIKCYCDKFNRKEFVEIKVHNYSDWGHVEDVYRCGWENFAMNSNIQINLENIDFFYNYTIAIDYYFGNAMNGSDTFKVVKILELLKQNNCEGITIDLIIENYGTWGQILFNYDFINNSIWQKR